MTPSISLTARWIFPVDAPPLEGGVVTLRGERIEAVEPRGRRGADIDLGNAAVLPGLVNAHTHLDLSGLHHPLPFRGSFTGWLREVIDYRRGRSADEVEGDVRRGVSECLSCGVTLVGDISSGGASWYVVDGTPLRAVVFHEVLGLPAGRACSAWSAVRAWAEHARPTPGCRPGVSPHAPYSVRASLYRATACLARARHLPLMTHLAETAAEELLLRERRGEFVDFLTGLGVWDPAGLAPSFEAVLDTIRSAPRILLAHGTHLPARLALPAHATVVHCPRTHAYFREKPPPFRDLLARGARLALGTDSRASSPDLDLLEELRFLAGQHPELGGPLLLRMATLAGAEALGWEEEVGSLTPGKQADLVVLGLPDREESDPHRLVLDSSQKVKQVILRGAAG